MFLSKQLGIILLKLSAAVYKIFFLKKQCLYIDDSGSSIAINQSKKFQHNDKNEVKVGS